MADQQQTVRSILESICYEHFDCDEPNCLQKKVNLEAEAAINKLIEAKQAAARIDELNNFIGDETPIEWRNLIENRITQLRPTTEGTG